MLPSSGSALDIAGRANSPWNNEPPAPLPLSHPMRARIMAESSPLAISSSRRPGRNRRGGKAQPQPPQQQSRRQAQQQAVDSAAASAEFGSAILPPLSDEAAMAAAGFAAASAYIPSSSAAAAAAAAATSGSQSARGPVRPRPPMLPSLPDSARGPSASPLYQPPRSHAGAGAALQALLNPLHAYTSSPSVLQDHPSPSSPLYASPSSLRRHRPVYKATPRIVNEFGAIDRVRIAELMSSHYRSPDHDEKQQQQQQHAQQQMSPRKPSLPKGALIPPRPRPSLTRVQSEAHAVSSAPESAAGSPRATMQRPVPPALLIPSSSLQPAAPSAPATASESVLFAEMDRQQLLAYLQSPSCRLWAPAAINAASGAVSLNAADAHQLLRACDQNAVLATMYLRALDAQGRRVNHVRELIAAMQQTMVQRTQILNRITGRSATKAKSAPNSAPGLSLFVNPQLTKLLDLAAIDRLLVTECASTPAAAVLALLDEWSTARTQFRYFNDLVVAVKLAEIRRACREFLGNESATLLHAKARRDVISKRVKDETIDAVIREAAALKRPPPGQEPAAAEEEEEESEESLQVPAAEMLSDALSQLSKLQRRGVRAESLPELIKIIQANQSLDDIAASALSPDQAAAATAAGGRRASSQPEETPVVDPSAMEAVLVYLAHPSNLLLDDSWHATYPSAARVHAQSPSEIAALSRLISAASGTAAATLDYLVHLEEFGHVFPSIAELVRTLPRADEELLNPKRPDEIHVSAAITRTARGAVGAGEHAGALSQSESTTSLASAGSPVAIFPSPYARASLTRQLSRSERAGGEALGHSSSAASLAALSSVDEYQPDEEMRFLQRHLCSIQCQLWTSPAAQPVALTDAEATALLAPNGASDDTDHGVLASLELFEEFGRVFSDLGALQTALRNEADAAVDRKTSLLAWLGPNGAGAPLLSASGVKLYEHSVERLYADCRAGSYTSRYLQALLESGRRFTDLDQLIRAVQTLHGSTVGRLRSQVRLLRLYLCGPTCNLFWIAPNVASLPTHVVMQILQAGAGSGALVPDVSSSSCPLPDVSSGSAEIVLLNLQLLERTLHAKFNSVSELLPALRHVSGRLDLVRDRLWAFFDSKHCRLLAPPMAPAKPHNAASMGLRPIDLDNLVTQSGAGASILLILHSLQASGQVFRSVDELINTALVSHAFDQGEKDDGGQRKTEKLMLLAYLRHDGPRTGTAAPAASAEAPQQPAPPLRLLSNIIHTVSLDDLDELFVRTRPLAPGSSDPTAALVEPLSSGSIFRAIQSLECKGKWTAHASWDEFVAAVRREVLAEQNDVEACLEFLRRDEAHGGGLLGEVGARKSLAKADVEILRDVVRGGGYAAPRDMDALSAANNTSHSLLLPHLHSLHALGFKFGRATGLAGGLRARFEEKAAAKEQLLVYLMSASQRVLVTDQAGVLHAYSAAATAPVPARPAKGVVVGSLAPFTLHDSDLSLLLDSSKSACAALYAFQCFAAQGRAPCDTLFELVEAVQEFLYLEPEERATEMRAIIKEAGMVLETRSAGASDVLAPQPLLSFLQRASGFASDGFVSHSRNVDLVSDVLLKLWSFRIQGLKFKTNMELKQYLAVYHLVNTTSSGGAEDVAAQASLSGNDHTRYFLSDEKLFLALMIYDPTQPLLKSRTTLLSSAATAAAAAAAGESQSKQSFSAQSSPSAPSITTSQEELAALISRGGGESPRVALLQIMDARVTGSCFDSVQHLIAATRASYQSCMAVQGSLEVKLNPAPVHPAAKAGSHSASPLKRASSRIMIQNQDSVLLRSLNYAAEVGPLQLVRLLEVCGIQPLAHVIPYLTSLESASLAFLRKIGAKSVGLQASTRGVRGGAGVVESRFHIKNFSDLIYLLRSIRGIKIDFSAAAKQATVVSPGGSKVVPPAYVERTASMVRTSLEAEAAAAKDAQERADLLARSSSLVDRMGLVLPGPAATLVEGVNPPSGMLDGLPLEVLADFSASSTGAEDGAAGKPYLKSLEELMCYPTRTLFQRDNPALISPFKSELNHLIAQVGPTAPGVEGGQNATPLDAADHEHLLRLLCTQLEWKGFSAPTLQGLAKELAKANRALQLAQRMLMQDDVFHSLEAGVGLHAGALSEYERSTLHIHSNCGPYLHFHLRCLAALRHTVGSYQQLVAALRAQHREFMQERAHELQLLRSYLLSAQCFLMWEKPVALSTFEAATLLEFNAFLPAITRRVPAGQRAGSLSIHPLLGSENAASLFLYFQMLQGACCKFESVAELSQALQSLWINQDILARQDVRALLPRLGINAPSDEDVFALLYDPLHGGLQSVLHLQLFVSAGAHFKSIDQLDETLTWSFLHSLETPNPHVLSHAQQAQQAASGAAAHHPHPSEGTEIRLKHVSQGSPSNLFIYAFLRSPVSCHRLHPQLKEALTLTQIHALRETVAAIAVEIDPASDNEGMATSGAKALEFVTLLYQLEDQDAPETAASAGEQAAVPTLGTFTELTDAFTQVTRAYFADKLALIEGLNSAELRSMWIDPNAAAPPSAKDSATSTIAAPVFTRDMIDALLRNIGCAVSPTSLLSLAQSLHKSGGTELTLDTLMAAHKREQASVARSKQLLFTYLASPAHQLLARSCVIHDCDLTALINAASTGAAALLILQRLERNILAQQAALEAQQKAHQADSDSFAAEECVRKLQLLRGGQSMSSLLSAVSAFAAAESDTWLDVAHFLVHSRLITGYDPAVLDCRTLLEDVGGSSVIAHVSVPLVWLFSQGARFDKWAHMVSAITEGKANQAAAALTAESATQTRDSSKDTSVVASPEPAMDEEARKEQHSVHFAAAARVLPSDEQLQLLVYLYGPTCSLLAAGVLFDPSGPGLSDLVAAGGGSANLTLGHLLALDREGLVVHSVAELMDALEHRQSEAMQQKHAVWNFFNSPECKLLASSSSNASSTRVRVSPANVNRLFALTQSEPDLGPRLLNTNVALLSRTSSSRFSDALAVHAPYRFFSHLVSGLRGFFPHQFRSAVTSTGAGAKPGIADDRTPLVETETAAIEDTRPGRKLIEGTSPLLLDRTTGSSISLSQHELDQIVQASGKSVHAAAMHLNLLAVSQRRFHSAPELLRAIQTAQQDSSERIRELQAFIAKAPGLFSGYARSQGVSLPLSDVSRLYNSSGAGPLTSIFLQELMDAKSEVDDVAALILRVRELHARFVERRAREIELLRIFFRASYDVKQLWGVAPDAAAAAGAATNSAKREMPQLSEQQLFSLLIAGHTGSGVVIHVQQLAMQEKRAPLRSVDELLRSLSAPLSERLYRAVLDVLQDPQSLLLPSAIAKSLTISSVKQLVDQASTGMDSLLHLWALRSTNSSFPTTQALADAMRAGELGCLEPLRAQHAILLAYLRSPTVLLLSSAHKTELGVRQVERLVELCGGSIAHTFSMLIALDHQNLQFQSVAQMASELVQINSAAAADDASNQEVRPVSSLARSRREKIELERMQSAVEPEVSSPSGRSAVAVHLPQPKPVPSVVVQPPSLWRQSSAEEDAAADASRAVASASSSAIAIPLIQAQLSDTPPGVAVAAAAPAAAPAPAAASADAAPSSSVLSPPVVAPGRVLRLSASSSAASVGSPPRSPTSTCSSASSRAEEVEAAAAMLASNRTQLLEWLQRGDTLRLFVGPNNGNAIVAALTESDADRLLKLTSPDGRGSSSTAVVECLAQLRALHPQLFPSVNALSTALLQNQRVLAEEEEKSKHPSAAAAPGDYSRAPARPKPPKVAVRSVNRTATFQLSPTADVII